MTHSKDDGLWHAEDYDDEPRSHGNFGLDPCTQMMIAETEARQRKEWKHELNLAYEFVCSSVSFVSRGEA